MSLCAISAFRYHTPIEVAAASIPVESDRALVIDLPQPPNGDVTDKAFLFRYDGKVHGYFSRCSHRTVPLDMDDERFFDPTGLIICRLHGARFDPATGAPLLGPALLPLWKLICEEAGDQLRILGWERGGFL
ncbi:MAG: Rieske 2Fe-2S domain-containing protein [Spirochaetia bacterium]|nr:Rieske 2Fe-2S domain-containing protein [Spirochaetia bacterium]